MYSKIRQEIESAKRDMNHAAKNDQLVQLKHLQQSMIELQAKDSEKKKLLDENSIRLKVYESRLKMAVWYNKIFIAAAIVLFLLLVISLNQ